MDCQLLALTAFKVAKVLRMMSRPTKCKPENFSIPTYLQAEIASNDVRGFAEHCLAFALIPSPIA